MLFVESTEDWHSAVRLCDASGIIAKSQQRVVFQYRLDDRLIGEIHD